MKNLKIRTKIIYIVMICFASMFIIVSTNLYDENQKKLKSLYQLRGIMEENCDENIKYQVNTLVSMIDSMYDQCKSENISQIETEKRIADIIRDLRYGEDGYFFVDTVYGDNIVLYGSKTEGTNRYYYQDFNGKYIIQEFIKKAISGGGYTDYLFTKEGEDRIQPKRAYTVYYEPMGWVVGTGIYTNDIDKIIAEKETYYNEEMKKYFFKYISLLLLVFILIITIMFIISQNIIKPVEYSVFYAESISKGNFYINIPDIYIKRKDEVGKLLKSLENMSNSLARLFEEKVIINDKLSSEKEFLDMILSNIGNNIVVIDEKSIIKFVNSELLINLNMKEEQFIGKKYTDIFKFFDKDNREIENYVITNNCKEEKTEIRRECFLIINGFKIYIEDSTSQILEKENNISGFVYSFRNINEKLEKQKEIEYLNYHDQLTGLYNRRYFENKCVSILEKKLFPVCLILADLNALKLTNDAFGHLMGDQLIISFSDILKDNFNDIGIVSRIGGDEFAILIPETNEETAKEIIESIEKYLKQSKINSIPISAAFGLAVYDNELYSFDETFKQADENMYKHKLNESEKIKRKILNCIIKENFKIYTNKKDEVKRVFRLSKAFGKEINLEKNHLERLKKAALVYDIGYVTINLEYLNKKDKLLEKEWEELKMHPATAYHILKNINRYSDISEIVLSHHENYDGTGYPRSLAKEMIPLEARILRIVIDYCAITSKRPYRDAMTKSKALEEISKYSGIRYDSHISSIFIEWMINQKEL